MRMIPKYKWWDHIIDPGSSNRQNVDPTATPHIFQIKFSHKEALALLEQHGYTHRFILPKKKFDYSLANLFDVLKNIEPEDNYSIIADGSVYCFCCKSETDAIAIRLQL